MTIKECIDIVDNIKPNQYTIKDKVTWLSFIDQVIINEVLKTHEGYDGRYDDFEGYSEDRLSVPLVVPSPYDRLYTEYLKMKIDGENGETARYNNSAAMYNAYMMEYRRHYNKTHMPLSLKGRHESKPSKNATVGLSEAEYENLKRDLYYQLSDYFSEFLSQDKLYDIVKNYVNNNIEMLTGAKEETPKARITNVTLKASSWVGDASPYSQVVHIGGVTEHSQVDLTPSVEQLNTFYNKDIAFVTENERGTVTVYAIGQKPKNDYVIQATISEVSV